MQIESQIERCRERDSYREMQIESSNSLNRSGDVSSLTVGVLGRRKPMINNS